MNPFTTQRRRAAIGTIISDCFAAACVAAVILGGSFAAGVIVQLLKGVL